MNSPVGDTVKKYALQTSQIVGASNDIFVQETGLLRGDMYTRSKL